MTIRPFPVVPGGSRSTLFAPVMRRANRATPEHLRLRCLFLTSIMHRVASRLPRRISSGLLPRVPRRAVSVLVSAPTFLRPVCVPSHIRTAVSTSGQHVEQLIDNLTDTEYSRAATDYLESLSEQLENLAETFPQLDVELTQGVMTLAVADLTYVINRQPPNKQIWFSSPISGPKRYDLIGGRWITLRDGLSLTEVLQAELLELLGDTVAFDLEN